MLLTNDHFQVKLYLVSDAVLSVWWLLVQEVDTFCNGHIGIRICIYIYIFNINIVICRELVVVQNSNQNNCNVGVAENMP